jgi:GMP synthase (glutamine-hydrolysing)
MRLLRIAILHPTTLVAFESAAVARFLRTAVATGEDLSFQITDFACREEQFPEATRLREYDGYIIPGSSASAYDAEPWIQKLEQTIRNIEQARIPLFGLCFGHQIVAQALGGRVERNPNGWEGSVLSFSLSEAGRLRLSTSGTSLALYYTHGDHVSSLPPGAESLGGSEHTLVQGFFKGAWVLCLQGHPEYTLERMRASLEIKDDSGFLTPDQLAEARSRLELPTDSMLVATVVVRTMQEAQAAAASRAPSTSL